VSQKKLLIKRPTLLNNYESPPIIILGFIFCFIFYLFYFIFLGGTKHVGWSPSTHLHFDQFFQRTIHNFLVCLKIYKKTQKIKIPKFIVYEIIKFIV
jgi:hypothetical protein